MSDERYDRSADMRLLDLQRKALGIPARVSGSMSYTDPDILADPLRSDDETFVQSGTILVAATDARPQTALIAGAVVTVSVSITNDGDVAARRVRIDLPLPADTTYRPGTIFIDGTACDDDIANELFSGGTELADIEPGARRTLSAKLLVEAGTRDIMLSPHLSASSGAVLGLRAIRLTRKLSSLGSDTLERPFYESDDAEHALEPPKPAPPQAAIDVVQPREEPPVVPAAAPIAAAAVIQPVAAVAAAFSPPVMPVAATPTRTKHATENVAKPAVKSAVKTAAPPAPKSSTKRVDESKVKPKPRVNPKKATQAEIATIAVPIARPKIEVVRSVDDRIAFAGQGGPILAVRIDRRRLATLSGLFSGASLGMIAHYLVLNALAVRDPLPGDGTDGAIAAFVASQEQLLSRALIATRLGKTPSPDSVGAILPAFPPALLTHSERRAIEPPPAGQAMLFRAFEPGEVSFVQQMLANVKASPFMRAAQLFVGLCANDAVLADEQERRRLGVALTAYAALATGEISRIFLHAKVGEAPALFKATDSTFDAAARTVLTALGRSTL